MILTSDEKDVIMTVVVEGGNRFVSISVLNKTTNSISTINLSEDEFETFVKEYDTQK